jgi:hypothetical protein
MKVVEGYFSGELVVHLIPNTKCPRPWGLRDGQNYFILQKIRQVDGTMEIVPPNDVRILSKDMFVTCVHPGYYRFEIYGAKP